MPSMTPQAARDAITRLFVSLRIPEPNAQIVADHLVDAEVAGVRSHGIMRVPQYVQALREGKIVPDAKLTVVRETGATRVLDGHGGFGQVMARQAADSAMELARTYGIGAVTLVNCSHTGRLGAYTEYVTRCGMIGLMLVNSGGHGQWVAPFGGREGRLATNPLSCAVPVAAGDPIVVDIATSVAPEGKIRAFLAGGQPVPEGWLLDNRGQPTTNPADLYATPRGALLPFGGHKGFGLAMMVEALAGGLSGAGCCADAGTPMAGKTDGVFFLAIHVSAFQAPGGFAQEMQQLVRHVKSAQPQAGFAEVLVPGEIEAKHRRAIDHLTVEGEIWEVLRSALNP